jgi:pyruvate kinase
MIQTPSPTRAEVNDVANAVLDGADAVMLSGETSVGKFPVLVIEHMRKIVSAAEKEGDIYHKVNPPAFEDNPFFISDSICYNASQMAEQSRAKAIAAMTHSGYSAYKIASYRPKAGIFIFTDNEALLTKLSLVWGVRGFYYDRYESTDQTIMEIREILKEKGFVQTNDIIVNIASIPMSERGRANMIKLSSVK